MYGIAKRVNAAGILSAGFKMAHQKRSRHYARNVGWDKTGAVATALDWYQAGLMTPCGDRNIFTPAELFEWWNIFHQFISIWAGYAKVAGDATTQQSAVSV